MAFSMELLRQAENQISHGNLVILSVMNNLIIMQLNKDISSLAVEIKEVEQRIKELDELRDIMWKSYAAEYKI